MNVFTNDNDEIQLMWNRVHSLAFNVITKGGDAAIIRNAYVILHFYLKGPVTFSIAEYLMV